MLGKELGIQSKTVNVFMILSVLGIIFSGASLQEVYAPGPRVSSDALEVQQS